MTNLDELERLLAAATQGKWEGCDCGACGCLWAVEPDTEIGIGNFEAENETGIVGVEKQQANRAITVALHNAAPALLAELRAARAVCELITLWAGVEMTTLHPDIAEALDAWQKARGEG